MDISRQNKITFGFWVATLIGLLFFARLLVETEVEPFPPIGATNEEKIAEYQLMEEQWFDEAFKSSAFNSLINSNTGEAKNRLLKIQEGDWSILESVTPEQIYAVTPYIENDLWKLRLEAYARWVEAGKP